MSKILSFKAFCNRSLENSILNINDRAGSRAHVGLFGDYGTAAGGFFASSPPFQVPICSKCHSFFRLHQECVALYKALTPTPLEEKVRLDTILELSQSIKKTWPGCRNLQVSVYGSFSTGLYLPLRYEFGLSTKFLYLLTRSVILTYV